MRREVDLPAGDIAALDVLGLQWETVASPTRHLLIHALPVPVGYQVSDAIVAVRLDTYPPGPLDMVYFSPPLERADGKPIGALSPAPIAGAVFQQWSRHYAWRQGEDSLASHLGRIRGWLRNELKKR